jgi:hypothetical protein
VRAAIGNLPGACVICLRFALCLSVCMPVFFFTWLISRGRGKEEGLHGAERGEIVTAHGITLHFPRDNNSAISGKSGRRRKIRLSLSVLSFGCLHVHAASSSKQCSTVDSPGAFLAIHRIVASGWWLVASFTIKRLLSKEGKAEANERVEACCGGTQKQSNHASARSCGFCDSIVEQSRHRWVSPETFPSPHLPTY